MATCSTRLLGGTETANWGVLQVPACKSKNLSTALFLLPANFGKKFPGRGCGVLNLGTHNEFSERHNGKDPDCMPFWCKNIHHFPSLDKKDKSCPRYGNRIQKYFVTRYSNGVYIPGHHTLPDDMEQSWVTCHHQVCDNWLHSKSTKYKTRWWQSGTHGKTTPWFAPGTAPVYGACGTLGGWNPFYFWICIKHPTVYQGGLRAATTMGRVTLVTAAATTVTGLPLERMLKNMIGLERFLSLSGLLDPTR